MNAPTRAADLPAAPTLTAAIVQNIDLLRRLAQPHTWASKLAMCAELGRDASNMNKTMKRLTEDGAVTGWEGLDDLKLTPFGEDVLRGVDVIEGRVVLPEGWAMVRHDLIIPNPDNPRKDFDSESALDALDALRISILEYGVRYPPEVYPADASGLHMLITGENRWRAVGMAIADGDLDEDFGLLVQIKDPGGEDAIVMAMDENIQRRNLTYTEEARAYERLVKQHGWTREKVADRFKRSVKHVGDYLRLLTIPAEALDQLEKGEITYRQARSLFQEHKPEPALFGDGALPKAKAGAEPPPAKTEAQISADVMALGIFPALALVVAELADKGEREPVQGFEPGWTVVGARPEDKASDKLVRNGLLMYRSFGDAVLAKVVLLSSGARAWLETNGFYGGPSARAELLANLRTEVVGETKALAAWKAGRYVTDWLNTAEADEQEPDDAEEAEDELAEEDKVPADFAGQVRHVVAESRREATEPGSPAKDSGYGMAAYTASADAKAVAELARDVSERLALWRSDTTRKPSSDLSWQDKAEQLAAYLQNGELTNALALVARMRVSLGAMGAAQFLTDAMRIVVKAAA